jgi:GtrA-like protein
VGISNALVDLGVLNLFLLIGPTRSPELLVLYNVVALGLANVNSYLWNTLWTFRDQARRRPASGPVHCPGAVERRGEQPPALGGGPRAYTGLSPFFSGNVAKAVSMLVASAMSLLFLRFFVFERKKA